MKKNSCTPINPKKYSCYGWRKIHARNLIAKENSCSSKISLPPHNFCNGPSLICSLCFYFDELSIYKWTEPWNIKGHFPESLGLRASVSSSLLPLLLQPRAKKKKKKKKKKKWMTGEGRGKKTFGQKPNFMPRGSLVLPDFPGLFKFRIENGFQNWRPEKVKQKSLRGVETILGTLSKDDERRGRGRTRSNFELKHVSTHVRFCPRWRHSSSTQRRERGKVCFDVLCRT